MPVRQVRLPRLFVLITCLVACSTFALRTGALPAQTLDVLPASTESRDKLFEEIASEVAP